MEMIRIWGTTLKKICSFVDGGYIKIKFSTKQHCSLLPLNIITEPLKKPRAPLSQDILLDKIVNFPFLAYKITLMQHL